MLPYRYAISTASWCKHRSIPVMIAESAPFGGIVTGVSDVNKAGYKGNTWLKWFTTVIHFIERFDVRLWSYINCDWDALPMYVFCSKFSLLFSFVMVSSSLSI